MAQLMNMSKFVKIMTQLVISITLFSYLFSKNSSLLSFLHSYNFYFTTFPYQLLTHTIDKNCMFLLCNGLLVFLAKYSGLNHQDESFINIIDDCLSENSMSDTKELILENEVVVKSTENVGIGLEEAHENEENLNNQVQDEERERNCFTISKEEEDEEKQICSNGDVGSGERVEIEEEEEEEEKQICSNDDIGSRERVEIEEEEGNGELSTEELNKKFDDFIIKMKTKLRNESQRQLIMV